MWRQSIKYFGAKFKLYTVHEHLEYLMKSSVIWQYPFCTGFLGLLLLLEEEILDFCTELCVKVCCGGFVISYMTQVASVCATKWGVLAWYLCNIAVQARPIFILNP